MHKASETETELSLAVAAEENADIGVTASFAPQRDGSYRVVLMVTNFGAQPAGPFDVTARADERSGHGFHRVRSATHGIASLEAGRRVVIESIRVPRPCPVKGRRPLALSA